MLTLLDLSAAFDRVDRKIACRHLMVLAGLSSLAWFTSYLTGRTQSASSSKPSEVLYGVPQGSVLGPILFLLYTVDVLQLVKSHQLSSHAYADDTQIYGFCQPSDIDALQERMSVCINDLIS